MATVHARGGISWGRQKDGGTSGILNTEAAHATGAGAQDPLSTARFRRSDERYIREAAQ